MGSPESIVASFLESILVYPISLYSLKVKGKHSNLFIEIELDHLEHPKGSVSIEDCEQVSNLLGGKLESFEDWNYTLQVSSAGAERQLRIPEDLKRFRGNLVQLEYEDSSSKLVSGKFRLIESTEDFVTLEKASKKQNGKQGSFQVPISKIKKGNLSIEF